MLLFVCLLTEECLADKPVSLVLNQMPHFKARFHTLPPCMVVFLIYLKALCRCPPSMCSGALWLDFPCLSALTAPLPVWCLPMVIESFKKTGSSTTFAILITIALWCPVAGFNKVPRQSGSPQQELARTLAINSLGQWGSWWAGGRYPAAAATSTTTTTAESNSTQCANCVTLRQRVNKYG